MTIPKITKPKIQTVGKIGLVLLALADAYGVGYINGKKVGDQIGAQRVKQELKVAAGQMINNYEHNMDVYKFFMYGSPEDSQHYSELYNQNLEKRNDMKSLVSVVLNDNITMGVENQ